MTLPINPEHLTAVVGALRADGVAYLNVGQEYRTHDGFKLIGKERVPPEWRASANATCEACGQRNWRTPICPDCRGTGKPIHTLTIEPGYSRSFLASSSDDPKPRSASRSAWACITCEGTGTLQAFDQRNPDPCPDCRGTGKPIHTLTNTGIECGVCGGIMHDHGAHEWEPVSVDVVVAELVLVDTWHGRALIREGNTQVIITPLGVPLSPGDWVAVLKVVAS